MFRLLLMLLALGFGLLNSPHADACPSGYTPCGNACCPK
jgi:hypothetical protein